MSAGLYAVVFITACFSAFLICPVHAQTYPVEAFAGTWEAEAGFTDDYYFNMTFSFPDEHTMYMDYYEELWGGSGTNRWTGPYSYDESSGVLTADLSTTFQIGSQGHEQVQESSLYYQMIDLNRIVDLRTSTEVYYKRISEPPVFPEEEEEAEEAEEENTEESGVSETEEQTEEEAEETGEEELNEGSEDADDGSDEEAFEDDEDDEAGDDEYDEEEGEDIEAEGEAEQEEDLDDATLKWLLNTDDEHLDEMKTIAETAGTTLGAIVISLLSAGIAGGMGGPVGPGAPGNGSGGPNTPGGGTQGPGTGRSPHGTKPFSVEETQAWKDYQNEIKQQMEDIRNARDEYQTELERQWEEAGVGIYDKQRYQDMMAERENQAWLERERAINRGPSREAIEWSREKAAMEKAFKEQDYKNSLFYKKGIYDGDYKAYKKQWIQDRQKESVIQSESEQRAAYMDAAYQTAKEIKTGADVAIDVMAELEPSGYGKYIKDGYKILSEAAGQTGEVMAGNQSMTQALKKTVTNASIELIKDHVDSTEAKLLTNVSGDGVKAYINARIEGKSHEEALKKGSEGAVQGLANFTVDYTVGKAFDGLTGGVNIRDTQVYNGLYKNHNLKPDGAPGWAKDLFRSGFTRGTISNDSVKNASSTLVSDLIKNAISGDDD
ncbi:MAG: hypothetical protein K6D90_05690 [Lachnospiraceae bacterium]|nr:hypothetical protein [Lachnospiraceae bacterium]